MGKIDIGSDRLLYWAIASIKGSTNGIKSNTGDQGSPGSLMTYIAGRAAVVGVLQLAIRERTNSENDAALEMVRDGMAQMGYDLEQPSWWNILPRCCTTPWGYHIAYGHGLDDLEALMLCPFGRGYWQLARAILGTDRKSLCAIARVSARQHAPRWAHWSVARHG